MHPLNNGSQVTTAPTPKNRIGSPGYFTESNEDGSPSYPGANWFNAVIKEFQNALSSSGVAFNPDKFDHFSNMLAANGSQFAPYRSDRTYICGEICTAIVDGELKMYQSYSLEPNLGHDPTDPLNRHEDWPDFPTPCWWIEYHGLIPGTPTFWPSDDIPENAMRVMDTDYDASFYHRVAARHPSLVSNGKINFVDVLGRFIRIADGDEYLVGDTHEDAIRNIVGTFANIAYPESQIGGTAAGAFEGKYEFGGTAFGVSISAGSVVSDENDGIRFEASKVVPTGSQNMPVGSVQNYIIFI